LLLKSKCTDILSLAPIDIFFIGADFIIAAMLIDFNDSVCNSLYDFVVVGCEENVALEVTQTVVYGSNAL